MGNAFLPMIAALAFASASSAQTVRIVDEAGSPGSFATMSLAIAASVDGDLILIKPGTYKAAPIDGKGLTVVADGAGVTLNSLSPVGLGFSAANLPSNLAINIGGLNVEAYLTDSKVLLIQDCVGPVQINDCSFVAVLDGFPGVLDIVTGEIHDSSAVSIVDSLVDGSRVLGTQEASGDHHQALISTKSNVFVFGSTIIGGKGKYGHFLERPGAGEDGPAGWTVIGGFGLGVRTDSYGSSGGDGSEIDGPSGSFNCGPGGDGGPGLALKAAGPVSDPEDPSFVRSSMTLIPGVGGEFYVLPCTDGDTGPDLTVLAGNLIDDDFAPRAFETDNLARVGSIKTEKFIGEPFDFVWHVFGGKPANPIFIPELTGAPTVAAPYFLRFRGIIPASGEKTINVVVPDLGVDFVVLYEEAYFYDGTRFYLSNPQFSVLLDDAF